MTPPDTDGSLAGRMLGLMALGGGVSGVADTLLARGPAILLGALTYPMQYVDVWAANNTAGAATLTAVDLNVIVSRFG